MIESTMINRNSHHHIAPLWLYLAIGGALLVLTAVTITVSYIDLGGWNIVVALVIASIKGSLVAMFFMHLYYDKKIYTIVIVMGLLFLSIFISLTMFDTGRRGDIYEIKSEPIKPEADFYKELPPADSLDQTGHSEH